MFKIAICDDVPSVCDELKSMIINMKNKFQCREITVDIFYSGEALIGDIKEENSYDLIFLDIELGNINGVEVGHIIREQMEDYTTKIIYISSKDTYDRQLFDVQPLHFLKKPIDSKKVFTDIQLAMKISVKENNIFEFKNLRNTVKIPYKDILYFESRRREVVLVGVKERHIFYDNIQNLIKKLPSFFIHPHRCYLVNYDLVACFKFEELIIRNGDIIPVSRNRRKEIREIQLVFESRGLN